tara:strand:+ start:71 stop:586 length:516 start_codon:yes stop_codon:yes gene_type:complete
MSTDYESMDIGELIKAFEAETKKMVQAYTGRFAEMTVEIDIHQRAAAEMQELLDRERHRRLALEATVDRLEKGIRDRAEMGLGFALCHSTFDRCRDAIKVEQRRLLALLDTGLPENDLQAVSDAARAYELEYLADLWEVDCKGEEGGRVATVHTSWLRERAEILRGGKGEG